jgi:hypothetical protein
MTVAGSAIVGKLSLNCASEARSQTGVRLFLWQSRRYSARRILLEN